MAELADSWVEDFFQPMYWGDPPRVADAMQQMAEWDMMRAVPLTLAIRRHQQGANYNLADDHAKRQQCSLTWQQPDIDSYDPARP